MEAYVVVENCQEGIEPEVGYANVLGIFLIDPKNKWKAYTKAEKCLRNRYTEAVVDKTGGDTEQENEPECDSEAGNMLCASWVRCCDDTAHFLDIRVVDVTE